MIEASTSQIWIVILALGIGTYLFRLSFLALIGDRTLPSWLRRALRFTPVAVLPAVVAPMLVENGGAAMDPAQMIAALATVLVGIMTRSVLYAIITGMGLFFVLGAFLA